MLINGPFDRVPRPAAYRRAMPQLLIIHHTVSPHWRRCSNLSSPERPPTASRASTAYEVRPALSATAGDVLAADAYLLGTPANIGYMSGALKHFFDQIYYPTRKATTGRPYGLYVHGNEGLEGAQIGRIGDQGPRVEAVPATGGGAW